MLWTLNLLNLLHILSAKTLSYVCLPVCKEL